MKNNLWIVGSVGGDDVIGEYVVSRPCRNREGESGQCARDWIMNGNQVKVFLSKHEAQKVADKCNQQ